MHNHFDQHLNIRSLLRTNRPTHVVECGAGTGECTRKIATLLDEWPFRFTVINDSQIPNLDPRVELRQAVSYLEFQNFPDDSIDFCIIDTDHNYWTLRVELDALHQKLMENSLIVLHDVSTFYHSTGLALSYFDGSDYPSKHIESSALKYGGLGNAVMDFLSENRFNYHLESFTSESEGACSIRKQKITEVLMMIPGSSPSYAQKSSDKRAEWIRTHPSIEEVYA